MHGNRVDPVRLLWGLPIGEYLLEQSGEILTLWQLSEGAPPEEAIEPAQTWPWMMETATTR